MIEHIFFCDHGDCSAHFTNVQTKPWAQLQDVAFRHGWVIRNQGGHLRCYCPEHMPFARPVVDTRPL